MVSRPRGPIGGWVYVYGVNTGKLRRCQIVDVSQPWDLDRHERLGRVVELSYEVTQSLCGSTTEPVMKCPVIVLNIDLCHFKKDNQEIQAAGPVKRGSSSARCSTMSSLWPSARS
jgi:hypothetical protein